ncbi:MAG TPA: rRNA adenine N-6-methyltransferase family protein [Ilumatobacteraceae bacterium]|nr:rRNA adenine N-6-methyltransferase family protein [Ilumatobacteraceae bacterium]
MSERRTARDLRRRRLGQNFLADDAVIARFLAGVDLRGAEVVVDLGAGAGALTRPLAALARSLGVEVWAVEADPHWADGLERSVSGLGVRVIRADLRSLRLPAVPYVAVGNLPFGRTTDVLARLLDRPERGPLRAELIVQRDVARKHATSPPTTLRTAAWAPWWEFHLGAAIDRRSFRPVPGVDAAALGVRRREPPVLPATLAPRFRETLRAAWSHAHDPAANSAAKSAGRPTTGRMRP